MSKHTSRRQILMTLIMLVLLAGFGFSALAQDDGEAPTTEETTAAPEEDAMAEMEATLAGYITNLDTVWMLVAAFLVFFMQAGFALVEAGFVRAKNVVNILMKNLFDFSIGSIGYWAVGFALMFGGTSAFIGGETFFFLNGIDDPVSDERIDELVDEGVLALGSDGEIIGDIPTQYDDLLGYTVPMAFFFFQLVFAATAATIVSGAVAGRTDFRGYIVYSVIVTALIYPIVGHWVWGGGWLASMDTPFHDFAGSTVVHSTGAWVALIGAIILGPRTGRFGPNATQIPGHNMTLAALGVFILWLGWFGFNPGSQLDSDASSIALITVNTNIAAATGAITAMLIGWYVQGVPQLPWGLNGALAGLVAITAPCAVVQPGEAIVIGAIGAAVMYGVVNLLENLRIDDPVGAVGVHGGAGVWGTLAVGIFGNSEGAGVFGIMHGGSADQLISQSLGIIGVAIFVILSAAVMFSLLKRAGILRASKQAEALGLDIYEHGMVAYPEYTNSPSEPALNS